MIMQVALHSIGIIAMILVVFNSMKIGSSAMTDVSLPLAAFISLLGSIIIIAAYMKVAWFY